MDDKNYEMMTIAELEAELQAEDRKVTMIRDRMRTIHNILEVKISQLPPSTADPKLRQVIK